jgi:hypothetical protein
MVALLIELCNVRHNALTIVPFLRTALFVKRPPERQDAWWE